MDWVLNNLDNVVIPLIIAILYFVGSAAQKKSKGDQPDVPPSGQEIDPDEARRVSEIKEEIRRKIAERTGRAQPPPPPAQESQQPAQPYVTSQPELKPARRVRRQAPFPAPKPAYSADTHKRELEAKMKKVRELEAQIKYKPLRESWDSSSMAPMVPRGALQRELFKDFSNPLGQKKAILVSEVLGSPVGIKGPSGWKSNV
ncbi:MAG: hypothetical protein CMI18_04120 [Opitutaceae bacterium]|nr:hypothetical protein [Opitutaceae bacterium]